MCCVGTAVRKGGGSSSQVPSSPVMQGWEFQALWKVSVPQACSRLGVTSCGDGLWGPVGDFEEKNFPSAREGKLSPTLEALGPALQVHLENQPLPQDGASGGWTRTKRAGLRGIWATNPSSLCLVLFTQMLPPAPLLDKSSLKVTAALLVLVYLVPAPS